MNGLQTTLVLALALMANGCAPFGPLKISGKSGETHYVVLGFGVVSVPSPDDSSSLMAARHLSAGLMISNQPGMKLNLGYSRGMVTSIPLDAQSLVEIDGDTFGSLRVKSVKTTKQEWVNENEKSE